MTTGEAFYCGLDECVRHGSLGVGTVVHLVVFAVLGWIGSRWFR